MNPIITLRIWTVDGKVVRFVFDDNKHNEHKIKEQMNSHASGVFLVLPSPITPGRNSKRDPGMLLDTAKVLAWEIE